MENVVVKGLLVGAAALLVSLPTIALACPQCAGNDGISGAFGIMMGAMILLPFPVAGLVYHIIKKGGDTSASDWE